MRRSNAIKWEETKDVLQVLDEHLLPVFESFFFGEYIRSGYNVPDSVAGLNDFLKSLTSQELDIFLNLKGNFGRDYIQDKTFIEILNYCVLRTNPLIQRPLLFAMRFIITRHEPSRNRLLNDVDTLKKIAITESDLKGFAIDILNSLGEDFSPQTAKQIVVKPNAEYDFYQTFREIIGSAKNYIHYIDNYANHVIIDYITRYCDMPNINEIKILTHHYIKDLRMVKQVFDKQYAHINLEIRSTDKYHDRYLFFHNEQWSLGTSIKDGGAKATTIIQLKDQAALDAISIFKSTWDSAISI